MKKEVPIFVAVMSLISLAPVTAAHRAQRAHHSGILSFHTMFGVDGAYVEEANAIRGVLGDELPWEIEGSAVGSLDENGHLRISVRGLVFADNERVPPDLRGKNDEPTFKAIVSCLDEDAAIVNLTTDAFAATHDGDSDIDAQLELPETCVAPLIFVVSGSEGHWFSVTGMEVE